MSSDLGPRLRSYRRRLHLSMAEVAEMLCVSESTYRDWEYGRSIKGEPYAKLAQIFGVGLSELLLGEEGSHESILAQLEIIERAIRRIRSKL